MKWFQNISAIEDLRKQYRMLLKKYHPDNPSGSVQATQEINREYDELFDILQKGEHRESHAEKHTSAEEGLFKETLQKIIHFNIDIEIIGNWIWCFNCYGYKDKLKALGFKWAPKKKAWIWHPLPYNKYHSGDVPLDEIRGKYGTQTLRKRNASAALDD